MMPHAKTINEVLKAFTVFGLSKTNEIATEILRFASSDRPGARLYHGCQEASWSPVESATGFFGPGVYLSDIMTAESKGRHKHLCKVDIRNPFIVPAQYLKATGYETPAMLAVLHTFGLKGLIDYLDRMNTTDSLDSERFYTGSAMTDFAKALGHDSIIAVYNDCSYEVVVFDPLKVSVVTK